MIDLNSCFYQTAHLLQTAALQCDSDSNACLFRGWASLEGPIFICSGAMFKLEEHLGHKKL